MIDETLIRYWRARSQFEAALRLAGPALKFTPDQVEQMIADLGPPGIDPPTLKEWKEARKVETDARREAFRLGLRLRRRDGLIVLQDCDLHELGVYHSWSAAAQAMRKKKLVFPAPRRGV
jgi:hypothetical protein